MRRLAGILIAALVPGVGACAQTAGHVEYVVTLARPQTQTVEVTMTIPGVEEAEIDVVMPSWRPGRYAVLDLAGGVRRLEAFGEDGSGLSVEKVDKATWRVRPAGPGAVRVRYEVYANALRDRTRHVDGTHAFLSGESVFVYEPTRRDAPVRVRIEAPEGWRVATALERDSGDPGAYVAPDYDALADAPFEIGEHEVLSFEVDGMPHEVAIWGSGRVGAFDLTGDMAKIVRAQSEIFGGIPYGRFVFIVHISPEAGGGTEHADSTVIQTSPATFDSAKGYRDFLGLVAHEVFHVWNVKRLRPASLVRYDYTRENYTDLLWLAEGGTTYYEGVTRVRAGVLTPDEYLRRLGEQIDAYRRTPGRGVQSPAAASFDAWIKFSRPSPDSVNSTVSFYTAGALASLVLDMEVRARTGGAASLDDVMRALYRDFPLAAGGYTRDDVVRALEEVSGSGFETFFSRHVEGTEELDLESALAAAGLELVREGRAQKDDEEEENAAGVDPGLDVRDANGRVVVRAARSDGAAYEAGVLAGDEIIAIDGRGVTFAEWDRRLGAIEPGARIGLLVLRGGMVREVTVEAGARPQAWKARRMSSASESQKDEYERWLGQAWPGRADAAEIERVLDDFHAAAADADFERYFGHFAESGVFLGTDSWERWTVEEFKAYARPHFEAGRGWTYRPKERRVVAGADGKTAWFDELLESASLGECRGTGALVRVEGAWRITQYSLSIPIPNEIADEVVDRIGALRRGREPGGD